MLVERFGQFCLQFEFGAQVEYRIDSDVKVLELPLHGPCRNSCVQGQCRRKNRLQIGLLDVQAQCRQGKRRAGGAFGLDAKQPFGAFAAQQQLSCRAHAERDGFAFIVFDIGDIRSKVQVFSLVLVQIALSVIHFASYLQLRVGSGHIGLTDGINPVISSA